MRKQEKDLYFVTTDHLERRIWFRDEEDFKAGMNAVPVVAVTLEVVIVAFILMSNHVHFVLYCTREEAQRFIDVYKKHHARYLRLKYGIKEALRGNKVDIQRILRAEESAEIVIAYVLMNAVAANICLHATAYPWGSGASYFKGSASTGKRIRTLSGRAAKRILHSNVRLPGIYLIGEEGYVLPESYVDVRFVESLFRTPKRMEYFLRNSSKAKLRLETGPETPAFRDQVLAAASDDLCHSLFRKNEVQELPEAQLSELLKQLRFRFSSHAGQLARVMGIPYERVVALLDAPETLLHGTEKQQSDSFVPRNGTKKSK